tara:strand:+ start:447 stop:824 length:378 start_codon:yes stop_codon:yes gene_type:complete
MKKTILICSECIWHVEYEKTHAPDNGVEHDHTWEHLTNTWPRCSPEETMAIVRHNLKKYAPLVPAGKQRAKMYYDDGACQICEHCHAVSLGRTPSECTVSVYTTGESVEPINKEGGSCERDICVF